MTDAHDMISRKAAIEAVQEYLAAWDDIAINGSSLALVSDAIRALPSVGVTEATDAPSTDDLVATMISDLSHTGELSMLYRMSIADAITELRAENARLRALPSGGVTEPTDAQTASACMSYRHDFGLLDERSRASTMFIAREWLRAWRKEFDVQPPMPSVGVKVKPLEWEESIKGRWMGTPPVKLGDLAFWIFHQHGGYVRHVTDKGAKGYPTLEAAKAAAQADYEARILAALDVQPAPDVAAVDLAMLRKEHAEWSQAQFGDVSAIGPAKHLAKEAIEVAADPTDAIEHADCWMLLWDMQRRAGIADDQLAEAIKTKLAINKARIWPAPKEGEAREHDRDAPTPLPDVAALRQIADLPHESLLWRDIALAAIAREGGDA